MKELQLIKPDTVKVAEVPNPSKFKQLGSVPVHPGHSCFELNLTTGEVTLAKYTQQDVNFDSKQVRKRIDTNPHCLYVTALNKRNAIKKFQRIIASNIANQNLVPVKP